MRSSAKHRGAASVGAVAFLFTLTVFSQPANAQRSPEVGKADALFNAGRSLLEAGEYVDACPKFAEAQALAPGLGVTLYLADCYERLGRTASAMVEFRRAEQIASTRGDKRGAIAHDRAASLEAHVPQLTLVVTDGARAQGVTVTRDGAPVPASQWEVPMPIDPGDHEIIVSAPPKVARRVVVNLAPLKGTVTLKVDPLEDRPASLPASLPLTADGSLMVSARGLPTQKMVGLVVGGVGILGVGIGSVLGVLASSKLSQSNDGPCDPTNHCSSSGLALRQDAEQFANASTGVFVGAGVALASGVILYVTAPRRAKEGTAGIEIVPLFSPRGVGLQVRSAF